MAVQAHMYITIRWLLSVGVEGYHVRKHHMRGTLFGMESAVFNVIRHLKLSAHGYLGLYSPYSFTGYFEYMHYEL